MSYLTILFTILSWAAVVYYAFTGKYDVAALFCVYALHLRLDRYEMRLREAAVEKAGGAK
jgi:hypothetical protein